MPWNDNDINRVTASENKCFFVLALLNVCCTFVTHVIFVILCWILSLPGKTYCCGNHSKVRGPRLYSVLWPKFALLNTVSAANSLSGCYRIICLALRSMHCDYLVKFCPLWILLLTYLLTYIVRYTNRRLTLPYLTLHYVPLHYTKYYTVCIASQASQCMWSETKTRKLNCVDVCERSLI